MATWARAGGTAASPSRLARSAPPLAAGVKPATPGVRSSDLKWRRESLPSNNLPSARSIYETVKVVDPSKDS